MGTRSALSDSSETISIRRYGHDLSKVKHYNAYKFMKIYSYI